MPLKIVRNDITKMETDAIVNTANPRPQVGDGVGRHDPAIVHRAGAVVNAVTAITLADLLAVRYGADWLRTGEKK